MTSVVCISGSIASGKSTLALALHEVIRNSVLRSFSSVVRAHVTAQGLPLTRAHMQQAGAELIDAGWPKFVGAVLEGLPDSRKDLLIIDGVRHIEAIDAVREVLPPRTPIIVVFLRADATILRERFAARGEEGSALQHPVESELGAVADAADLVIDATAPIEFAVDKIVRLLRGRSTRG